MKAIRVRFYFFPQDVLWVVMLLIATVLFLALAFGHAFAADNGVTVLTVPVAPPVPTIWNLGAILEWLKPLIVSAFSAAASGALIWLLKQVFSYMHITISDKDYDVIRRDAQAQVQKLVAMGVDKLETVNVTIDSPLINQVVTAMQASVPDIIKKLGLTPEKLAEIALAAIGQHQTEMKKAAIAAPVVAVSPVEAVKS